MGEGVGCRPKRSLCKTLRNIAFALPDTVAGMDVARLSIVVALGFGLIGCDGEVSACEGATPYLFNGEDRGFVQCEGGLIHRELAK